MRNSLDDSLPIPGQARDLAGFRAWAVSPRFPERGRIDFLAGRLEVDMSPEDLQTHSLVKSEIAAVFQCLVTRRGLGEVYIDRARISSPAADLSVEPDVVVVLWEALDSGRWGAVPAASGKPGRFIEMEGARTWWLRFSATARSAKTSSGCHRSTPPPAFRSSGGWTRERNASASRSWRWQRTATSE